MMKKVLFGLFVVVMAIAGCDSESGVNDGGGDGGLSGTWTADTLSYTTLIFSGNTFTLMSYTSVGLSGTVSGNILTPSGGVYFTTGYDPITGQGTATVSGSTLTVSGFGGGCSAFIHDTYRR
jgi:hypothetical protein